MKVKISFLGDISLNDEYRSLAAGEKPFASVSPILERSDFVVGNLECLAAGSEGENPLKQPRLKTDLRTLEHLKDLHLDLVTLAHNHAYDNLLDGFSNTVAFLEEKGMSHMGAAPRAEDAGRPFVTEIRGIRFGFLNYVSSDTHPSLPEDAPLHLNWLKPERLQTEVQSLRASVDYVIVLLHWGGLAERMYYPHPGQRILARRISEWGADLIVGHHSHTLQPSETFGGTRVFYSLGNFCFADIFSEGRRWEIDWKRECESAILNVRFDRDSYSVDLVPIRNDALRVFPDDSFAREFRRRCLYFRLLFRFRLFWHLYGLKFRYFDPILFYFRGNDRRPWQQLRRLSWSKVRGFLRLYAGRNDGGSDSHVSPADQVRSSSSKKAVTGGTP